MAWGNIFPTIGTPGFQPIGPGPQSGTPGFQPPGPGPQFGAPGTTETFPGPHSGGMAAALAQQAQLQNMLSLSAQAQQTLNPSFEDARTALTGAITNPPVRSDIQLTPQHQVVVLDEFMSGTLGRPAHGFGVADIVRQVGGLSHDQIALVSDSIPNPSLPAPHRLLTAPGDVSASDRVNALVETTIARGLSQTNSALEAVAAQRTPNLRGVNYSTSGSSLNGFMYLNEVAIRQNPDGTRELTPEGRVIFEGLGISQELNRDTLRQFAERGVARFEQVRDQSPLVQGQVQRHEAISKRLQEMGIHYTVAAGNDGGVIDEYRSVGVNMPDTADDNLYANPYNVTVGALDTRGTVDPGDDRVAGFSVQDPEVDFLANGVDRRVTVFGQEQTVSGTSYSAPDVNARLVALSRQNPGLSASAIQNMLRNSAGPNVPGSAVSALR